MEAPAAVDEPQTASAPRADKPTPMSVAAGRVRKGIERLTAKLEGDVRFSRHLTECNTLNSDLDDFMSIFAVRSYSQHYLNKAASYLLFAEFVASLDDEDGSVQALVWDKIMECKAVLTQKKRFRYWRLAYVGVYHITRITEFVWNFIRTGEVGDLTEVKKFLEQMKLEAETSGIIGEHTNAMTQEISSLIYKLLRNSQQAHGGDSDVAELRIKIKDYQQQISEMQDYYVREMQQLRNARPTEHSPIAVESVHHTQLATAEQQESPFTVLQRELQNMRQEFRDAEQMQLDRLCLLTGEREKELQDKLNSQLKEKDQEMIALKDEKDKEMTQLTAEHESCVVQLRQEIEALKQQLQDAYDAIDVLHLRPVSSSDCELQAAVVQTEETHETLADMEGKLTAAIAQLNDLETKCVDYEKELDIYGEFVTKLKDELLNSESQCAKLQSQVDQLQAKVNKLREKGLPTYTQKLRIELKATKAKMSELQAANEEMKRQHSDNIFRLKTKFQLDLKQLADERSDSVPGTPGTPGTQKSSPSRPWSVASARSDHMGSPDRRRSGAATPVSEPAESSSVARLEAENAELRAKLKVVESASSVVTQETAFYLNQVLELKKRLESHKSAVHQYRLTMLQFRGMDDTAEMRLLGFHIEDDMAAMEAELSEMKMPSPSELFSAARSNDLEVLQRFLNMDGDVNITNDDKATMLHYAAFNGNVGMTKLLVSRGANVDARLKWGATPLHCAAYAGNDEVAQVLLSAGADVNAKNDVWQSTPLWHAVHHHRSSMITLLQQNGGKDEGRPHVKRRPSSAGDSPLRDSFFKF